MRIGTFARWTLGGALVFAGCTSQTALRHSFSGYGDIYAESQNRQMLLNLARLHEHQPPYFFQLTQISASYTFTSQAGLGDSKEIGLTTSPTANFHLATGSLTGGATQQPVFTLVPLAGDKFAQQLLQPMRPVVFYNLFEEGWPIDLLMRTLIEKIEIYPGTPSSGEAGKDSETVIIENNPWQAIQDRDDPVNAILDGPNGYYDRFLRACALAREFQKHGLLYVDVDSSAKAEDSGSQKENEQQALAKLLKTLTTALEKSGGQGGQAGGGGAGGSSGEADRSAALLHFQLINNPTSRTLCRELAQQPEYWGSDNPVERFYTLLFRGFTVESPTSGPQADKTIRVRLIMRSMMTVMNALANEADGYRLFRDYYDAALARHPRRPAAPDIEAFVRAFPTGITGAPIPPPDAAIYWAPIPPLEDHPALSLVHEPGESLTEPFVSLDFTGKHYTVADRATGPGEAPATWNRDVFRLLMQISFLATTDPASYSSPSLLQLH